MRRGFSPVAGRRSSRRGTSKVAIQEVKSDGSGGDSIRAVVILEIQRASCLIYRSKVKKTRETLARRQKKVVGSSVPSDRDCDVISLLSSQGWVMTRMMGEAN